MKKFKATWGEGYVHPETSIISLDEIDNNNGWEEWAIEKIDALAIGQSADCSDISGVVNVQRIS